MMVLLKMFVAGSLIGVETLSGKLIKSKGYLEKMKEVLFEKHKGFIYTQKRLPTFVIEVPTGKGADE